MTTLLDSNVLIDALRGRVKPARLIEDELRRGEVMAASVLSRTELLQGMRTADLEAFEHLGRSLLWVPVTEPIADAAGALARRHRRSHAGIETVDYVIAATAELLSARLWTLNVRHFPMFSALAPPY